MKPVIVLDYDGTLVDSMSDGYNAVCKIFVEEGLNPPSRDEYQRSVPSYYLWYQSHGVTLTVGAVSERFDRYRQKEPYSLFPKAREFVWELKKRGHILLLASTNYGANVLPILYDHGLADAFSAWFCGSNDKAEAIRCLCKQVDAPVQRESVIIVGDTPHDMAVAQALCVQGIGITHGLFSQAILIESGADHCVDSFAKLLEYIGD
ncbi:MAG: HAD family hydrolase [Candidatus Pacebacteria bacterium]|nr:HAD family hydrolase [Candidatus Paceibacterota bacterium]